MPRLPGLHRFLLRYSRYERCCRLLRASLWRYDAIISDFTPLHAAMPLSPHIFFFFFLMPYARFTLHAYATLLMFRAHYLRRR